MKFYAEHDQTTGKKSVPAILVKLTGFWSCDSAVLRKTTLDHQEEGKASISQVSGHVEMLESAVQGALQRVTVLCCILLSDGEMADK